MAGIFAVPVFSVVQWCEGRISDKCFSGALTFSKLEHESRGCLAGHMISFKNVF
jgi:hypothetical protein